MSSRKPKNLFLHYLKIILSHGKRLCGVQETTHSKTIKVQSVSLGNRRYLRARKKNPRRKVKIIAPYQIHALGIHDFYIEYYILDIVHPYSSLWYTRSSLTGAGQIENKTLKEKLNHSSWSPAVSRYAHPPRPPCLRSARGFPDTQWCRCQNEQLASSNIMFVNHDDDSAHVMIFYLLC